jgi:hypothetical protein
LKRIYAGIGAALGWTALVLQFYLLLANRTVSVPESILRYFSYFTILTNLLAAVSFTAVCVQSSGKAFFVRATTLSAVTVYILIVGLVYNIILRSLWDPRGLQLLVDEFLHTAQPLLFLVFWLLFVPKKELKWKHAFNWLLYPCVYIIYLLITGAVTGFYPYPFADVNKLGYTTAMLNGVLIIACFLILSLLLVGAARISSR